MEIQLAAAAVRALEAALKRKLEGEAVGEFNVDAAAEASALLKRARGNSEGGAATQSGRPEAGAAGRADGFADRGDANNADAHRSESSKRPAVGGSRPAARGGADDVMPTRSELEAIWQLVHSGYFAGGGEGELREGQGAHEAADLAGASGSRGDGSLPRAVGTSEVAAREGRAIRKAWEESLSAQGGAGGGAGERGGRGDDFGGGGGQQSSKKGQNLGPQAMAARKRREREDARMQVLHARTATPSCTRASFSPSQMRRERVNAHAAGAGERTHAGAAGAGAGGSHDDDRELPAGGRSPMRRERVNARMQVLQGLVPGAATMTTESFLLEAVLSAPHTHFHTPTPTPPPSDAAGAGQRTYEGAAGAGAGCSHDDYRELPAGGGSLRALPAAAGHGALTADSPPPPSPVCPLLVCGIVSKAVWHRLDSPSCWRRFTTAVWHGALSAAPPPPGAFLPAASSPALHLARFSRFLLQQLMVRRVLLRVQGASWHQWSLFVPPCAHPATLAPSFLSSLTARHAPAMPPPCAMPSTLPPCPRAAVCSSSPPACILPTLISAALTVRAAGESGDTPATDSRAAAAASAGSKTTPEAASSESPSASGVPVLTIVAGVFVFALVIFALFSLASAILGIFLR
ncbi:unnamed protein product [Closterium sp. Naga37s-1]|nr:unnamed protein product [Closterium sp. Naga37s-1]